MPFTRLFCSLAFATLIAATLEAQDSGVRVNGPDLPLISISDAIRDSNGDTIPDRIGQRVRVRGVVTVGSGVISSARLQVYFQDETAGMYLFSMEPGRAEIPAGSYIEVTGTVDQYRGAVQVNRPEYVLLGERPLPEPKRMRLGQIADWANYGQLVRVTGRLGIPEQVGPYVSYGFEGDGTTRIRLMLPPGVLRELSIESIPQGSEITATGVVTIYSETPPHTEGFQVLVGSPSWISIESLPAAVEAPAPPSETSSAGYPWSAVIIVVGAAVLILILFAMIRMFRRRMKLSKRQVETLSALGPLAAAASDADVFLREAMELLIRNRLVDGVVLHLLEHGRLRLHASYGIGSEKEKLVDEHIQSRVSGRVQDLPAGEFRMLDERRGEALYPLVCLALQGRSRAVGVMTALTATRHALTPREAGMIASAANLIALGIENVQVMRENDEKQTELEQLAISDPLTGLYNRRFMDEYLRIHMAMARRQQARVSFVAIDLDHFKKLNDAYGHDRGDQVLVQVASVIREAARTSDLAVRSGGEEFMVVMAGADQDGAMVYARRVQAELRSQTYEGVSPDFQVTVSIGIAVYPEHGTTLPALLRVADESLYEAKRAGRDRIAIGASNPLILSS